LRKIKALTGKLRVDTRMMNDPLSYALRNVPRYTSYPTAPHFHEGVTPKTYADWLSAIKSNDTLSLYLHVPFCRELCHYCGCQTKATRQDAPLKAYATTLGKEIRLVGSHLRDAGPVKHIHWGGGTPSLLQRQSFIELTGLLRALFDLSPDLEHAIELDPRLVTPELAETFAMVGINRASLGVQDFDLDVQKAIGRVQPFDVVAKAASELRAVGLTALNFDLMYGLPGQTRSTILDTVEKTVSLAPGRIALFGYAHVPWMRKHQRLIDEATLPSAVERLELADLAREELLKAGYVAIGLDHFSRTDDSMAIALDDGSLKRNFQGYTTDQGEELIGIGASSIGKVSKGFAQNHSDVRNWKRCVDAGELPIARGLALSTDDRMRGRIIEELMTNYACDLSPVCKDYGLTTHDLADAISALEDLVTDGLVQLELGDNDNAMVQVTEAGRPYVRLAAAAFDAYLAESLNTGKARHSAAV
jgi:oxygen-independent coproporphyrinogen III oxidase